MTFKRFLWLLYILRIEFETDCMLAFEIDVNLTVGQSMVLSNYVILRSHCENECDYGKLNIGTE